MPGYNNWPFGLAERTSGYTVGMTRRAAEEKTVSRPVTFLLGQVDTLPLGGFDSSPNAMAQGPTRRARGEAFVKYINEKLGAKHKMQIVSGVRAQRPLRLHDAGSVAGHFPETLTKRGRSWSPVTAERLGATPCLA